jgi:hypothetical protein
MSKNTQKDAEIKVEEIEKISETEEKVEESKEESKKSAKKEKNEVIYNGTPRMQKFNQLNQK